MAKKAMQNEQAPSKIPNGGQMEGQPQGGDAKKASPRISTLKVLTPHILRYKWRFLIAFLAMVVSSGTVLIIGSGLQYLINHGLLAKSTAVLDQALLMLLGIITLLAGSTFVRYYYISWLGERVVANIRTQIFEHVLKLDIPFFETQKTADVISRLTTDMTLLLTMVSGALPWAVRNTILMVGGLIALLLTDWKLSLFVLLIVPLVVLPILIFGRMVKNLSKKAQEKTADVGHQIDENLYGIRTVQVFAQETAASNQFTKKSEEAFEAALLRISARARLTALIIFIVFTAIGVVVWLGGRDVLLGRLSLGELTSFLFYSVLVASSVGALGELSGDLMRAAGAMERIMELQNYPIAADTLPVLKTPLTTPATVADGAAVQFENVCFTYASRPDKRVLDDLNLSVNSGERIALVGSSGAGKSTLFSLMLRFYEPDSGAICINGVDIKSIPLQNLRTLFGVVPQEPVIFSATIHDNIAYGRPESSEADIIEAAKTAYIHDFIAGLPDGYQTLTGERGVRLSGGQKQRLAIARAVLCNPSILLLDEATSSLDAESERMIQQALEKLSIGRTTFMIAHRLATVQNADRICVLDNGRIVESGTHDALMMAGGLYAKLASLQFRA